MAVDPRSFVEPSLEVRCIDAHRHRVARAVSQDVGDIVAERAVPSWLAADQDAVDVDSTVAIHSAELDPDPFPLVAGGNGQRAAIPADAVVGKPHADRLVAVVALVGG